MSNSLDSDKDQHSVGPYLGPNCLKVYLQTTKLATSMDRINIYTQLLSGNRELIKGLSL